MRSAPTAAGEVKVSKTVEPGMNLHEQALESAAARAETSSVLVEKPEAACRA